MEINDVSLYLEPQVLIARLHGNFVNGGIHRHPVDVGVHGAGVHGAVDMVMDLELAAFQREVRPPGGEGGVWRLRVIGT